MKRLLIFFFFGLFLIASVHAKIIINPTQEHVTIQAGINSAMTGDTVLVQPGTYIENISFNDENIVLGSLFLTTDDTTYISQTIINGNQSGLQSVLQVEKIPLRY